MVEFVDGPDCFYLALAFHWLILNYTKDLMRDIGDLPSLSFYFSSERVGSISSHPFGYFLVREVVIFGMFKLLIILLGRN